MQDIEPFYNWRHIYIASEDQHSPFFNREYSEFEYTNQIYNFLIHPQWDDIGSPTLFIKILYADYETGYAVIELFGEWNDCLNNDIMFLKRDIIDPMISSGISKFLLIGENVLNFHYSDDCYYEEWFEEIEEGWIAFLNFREHVLKEFERSNIDNYILMNGKLNEVKWRTLHPFELCNRIDSFVMKRLA